MNGRLADFRLGPRAVVLVPALAAFLLYGPCVTLWWSGDDLAYLRSVILHSPAENLFVPQAYRDLSTVFFFPGVLVSFGVDHLLFGSDPRFYFVHQLLSLAAATALLARLLSRFLPAAAAVAAGLLFLVGPPLPFLVGDLSVRHYLEGLVFALAAVLLFLRFLETRRTRWLAGAAVAYFLAALCKEIFVPLPLVLAALPGASVRETWRSLWPFAAGGALYAVWRLALLETPLAAYESLSGGIAGRLILLGKQFAVTGLGRQGTAAKAVLAAVLILSIVALVRRRAFLLPAALVASVAAPLWPVAAHSAARFGFLWWLLVALLVGWASAAWLDAGGPGRVLAVLIPAAALAVAFPANRDAWSSVRAGNARNRAEGEYFLQVSRKGDVLRQPLAERGFYANLRWLRQNERNGDEPGAVVYDDIYFCEAGRADEIVHSFSGTSGRVEAGLLTGSSLCSELRRRLREAPLSVRLTYDDPFISWQVGPRAAGSYSLVYGDEFALYPVASSGSARYQIRDLTLRVKYESPDGWLTYSPALRLEARDARAEARWESPSPQVSR